MGRTLTKQQWHELGKLGGRPKGSLSPNRIKAIATKEAMIKEIEKQTGRIVSNLLVGSDKLDVAASKELFDRAFGKAHQSIDVKMAVFSLKDLAEYRDQARKAKQDTLQGVPQPEEKKP